MRLNTLKPAPGAKRPRLRVGRGASAGQGKTCGRGVKGQRARKGGYHKVGFEGGQMPIQRRLPKVGFRSAMAVTRAEVRLGELARIEGDTVDLEALKKAGIVPAEAERAKVVLSGSLAKAVTLKGIKVTKGARAAIEAAGGKIISDEACRTPRGPPQAIVSSGRTARQLAWRIRHSAIRPAPWAKLRVSARSARACCSWSAP